MDNNHSGAIIIMDCCNKHWDNDTNIISDNLNIEINKFVKEKRDLGYIIIHCPNDCYEYYKKYKNYLKNIDYDHKIKNLPNSLHESLLNELPYRFKDPINSSKCWYKQNDIIEIKDEDKICLDGNNIIKILKKNKIDDIYYV